MIDKRKRYYIVLDTETCPLTPKSEVSPQNGFVYDIGWAVVDRSGNVYDTKSYIVNDIFFGERDLMKSAYYAEKIPNYLRDIQNNNRVVSTFYQVRADLLNTMREYNINTVIAHNARFDYGVLQNTQRWLTKSKYRYFFPYGTQIWDTMKMANDTICKQKSYRQWCFQNGHVTKNGQVRKTAEIIFKYISGDYGFIEKHTALEDVLIEKDIFAHCMRQHKTMRKALWA